MNIKMDKDTKIKMDYLMANGCTPEDILRRAVINQYVIKLGQKKYFKLSPIPKS